MQRDGNGTGSRCLPCGREDEKMRQRELRQSRPPKVRTLLSATFNGRTMTLGEWAAEIGIPLGRLKSRIRSGWPPERVFDARDNRALTAHDGRGTASRRYLAMRPKGSRRIPTLDVLEVKALPERCPACGTAGAPKSDGQAPITRLSCDRCKWWARYRVRSSEVG
jgi:hypothetical protein